MQFVFCFAVQIVGWTVNVASSDHGNCGSVILGNVKHVTFIVLSYIITTDPSKVTLIVGENIHTVQGSMVIKMLVIL